MTPREGALLMGLPAKWRLPLASRAAQRAVGNAMCVALSKAIVLSAMAVQNGLDAAGAPAAPGELRRVKRRLEALEEKVEALYKAVTVANTPVDE